MIGMLSAVILMASALSPAAANDESAGGRQLRTLWFKKLSCGGSWQKCCWDQHKSNNGCESGFSCRWGLCKPIKCGWEGQQCCDDGCKDGLTCTGGKCSKEQPSCSGDAGTPCCDEAWYGYKCSTGNTCDGNTCVPKEKPACKAGNGVDCCDDSFASECSGDLVCNADTNKCNPEQPPCSGDAGTPCCDKLWYGYECSTGNKCDGSTCVPKEKPACQAGNGDDCCDDSFATECADGLECDASKTCIAPCGTIGNSCCADKSDTYPNGCHDQAAVCDYKHTCTTCAANCNECS